MFVSEDGYPTGSIDMSKLDEIDPKTDEAKAQIAALKAAAQAGQEQAAQDNRDAQGKPVADVQPEQPVQPVQPVQAVQEGDEVKQLQAEAAAAGVTFDKRWGADRLRQALEQAKSSGKQS
jgi:hypothetical protein